MMINGLKQWFANQLSTPQRVSRYFAMTLGSVFVIQFCLFLEGLLDNKVLIGLASIEWGLHLISLVMLVGIGFSRHVLLNLQSREAESRDEQLAAMITMFGAVKHKLNNDMQVVLGNAELAEILISTNGDLSKPVHNITDAANQAVERIAQLSVYGSSGKPIPQPIDLNAMLRKSMATLAEELPPIVTLRLELGNLTTPVVVDRYLLSLSLAHLVRKSVLSMRHGGEIVLRTFDAPDHTNQAGIGVGAEVCIVRALTHAAVLKAAQPSGINSTVANGGQVSDDITELQEGLATTKALVIRSGVKTVSLSHTDDESLFAMNFETESLTAAVTKQLPLVQLHRL